MDNIHHDKNIGLLAHFTKAAILVKQKHHLGAQMSNPCVDILLSLTASSSSSSSESADLLISLATSSPSSPTSYSAEERGQTISAAVEKPKAMAKNIVEPYLVHERIAQRVLSEEKKEHFSKAWLLGLYIAMKKPVDEEIAQEAVRNYDGDNQQTVIQNVVVKATREHLTEQLRLTATNKGEAWDAKKIKSS